MEEHPKMERLELLQQGKLKGAELLEILRHLEKCDHCYQNLPPQNPDEVISRLLKNDDQENCDSDFLKDGSPFVN